MTAGLKSIRVGIWPEQAPLLEPPDHSPDFFARIRGKYALAFGRGQTDFQKASDLLHCLRVIVEPALILKDRRVIEFGKINHQCSALGNLRKSTVEGMTKTLHNGRDGIAWIPNREEHVGCRKVCEKLEEKNPRCPRKIARRSPIAHAALFFWPAFASSGFRQ